MKKLALFIISFLFINSLFALNNNDKKQFISYGIGYDIYIQNIVDEHSPMLCLDGLSFVTKKEKIFNNFHEILLSYITMNLITVLGMFLYQILIIQKLIFPCLITYQLEYH